MTTGHRYRLIIYFAALVLCLSVCFAYAEEPALSESTPATSVSLPCTDPAPSFVTPPQPTARLLFYTAPGRSNFMPVLTASLVAASAPTEHPVYADAALQSLSAHGNHAHGHVHSLFPSRRKLKLVTAHSAEHLSAAASDGAQINAAPEADAQ